MQITIKIFLKISDKFSKKLNNYANVKIINVPGIYEIPITIRKNVKNLMVLLLWDVSLKVKPRILT